MQALEQLGHVAVFVLLQLIQSHGLYGIHPCIDMASGNWFFLKPHNGQPIHFNHTEGVLPLMKPHCHGGVGRMTVVKIEQVAVANVGENIAIGQVIIP